MIGQLLSGLKRKNSQMWSASVGRMHSRNNIKTLGNRIFLSSSGARWNDADDRDGVYCIDLRLGQIVWFTATQADANEIAIIGDTLLVGTDSGHVFAINLESGAVVAKITVSSSVYVHAVELEPGCAALISHAGEVIYYDATKHEFLSFGVISGKFRANPVRIGSRSFLAATEDGVVWNVELADGSVIAREVFRVPPHKASGAYDFDLQVRGVSSLTVLDDQVVISYVRNTYDRRPPLLSFSLKTGQKLWDGGRIQSASTSERQEFGNSRVTPVVWKNFILTTFAYNESVHAFSLQTGKWVWRLRLDDSYFQNWSSPVLDGDTLYVARINGVLSVIDLGLRKITSSYSIEVFDSQKDFSVETGNVWPNAINQLDLSGPYPGQQIIAGICSTPAISGDKILVGTVSGNICCINSERSSD